MPFILANYSNAEVQALKRLSRDAVLANPNTGEVAIAILDGNPDIKVILISDPDDLTVKRRLKESGWHDWQTYANPAYGTTIYALARKPLIN
jgi:hypothetical protein